MEFLVVVSAIFGWVYFLLWSLSFYPQALLNWRRQSTSGTTVDFPLLNILGFTAYYASNQAFLSSTTVRDQYASRHSGLEPTVRLNDVCFALHGLILSIVTTSQYLLPRTLWGFEPSVGSRPSKVALGVYAGSLVGVAVTLLLAAGSGSGAADDDDGDDGWRALDVVYAVGYVKVVVTLVKYTPQALQNWRNRSTVGWSIAQILLDLGGGVLSLAQLAIDSYLERDWSGVTGNPVKFALGNASLLYDGIFVVQHYILYRHAREDKGGGEEEEADEGAEVDEERRALL
ncbi:cystinosin [Geosmithia morbida]|uniref:Cystinosin n=1 Tax=Geosmithia morbida TaxID=1094350 RepID=A0A9P4YQ61_9HYPO|nr:cystinosin [Geosmithia morbida]KAF4119591.1 cystinosin [Geosmithia morbida]